MKKAGIDERLVKVRVLAATDNVDEVAGYISDVLENNGYSVFEWTKPYPCQPPEEDKFKVFISARRS